MDNLIAGKYKIDKLIGKGGFGEVYTALNTKTNEDVCIKMETKFGK